MLDISTLTDEQIIELTSVVFTTNDSTEVLMPLDDIKVIDGTTIELGSNIYRIKAEEVRKIVVKKGKYNLIKAKLDPVEVTKMIESITTDLTNKLLAKYADELQINSKTLEDRVKVVNDTTNILNKCATDILDIMSDISSSQKKLENNLSNVVDNLDTKVTKVVKELEVLIEE